MLRKLLNIALSIALAHSLAAPGMGLIPRDEGRAAWESLQGRVLNALGGSCEPVNQPVARVAAASTTGATGVELPANQVVTVKLHKMDQVVFALGHGRHGLEKSAGKLA